MNKIIHKSVIFERILEKLLKKEGFSIEKENRFGGFAFQPDFIIKKGNQNSIIELKVTDIITEKTLYQILYYQSKLKIDSAYLALPEECKINHEIKNKLLEHNVGIITIKKNNLLFEEPIAKKQLSSSDLINYAVFSGQKNVEEISKKVEEISIELFLYILTGSLLVYAISNLLEFYFEKPLYLWLLLLVCIIIIVATFIYYKNKKHMRNEKTHN